MGIPFAEVIGDPIAHSKSPLIHNFWLEKLEIEGEFRRTRVHHNDLSDFLRARRSDPDWRGCSVTSPHKVRVIDWLDAFTSKAAATGAVNCVYRDETGLVGSNTDIAGVTEIFESAVRQPNTVTLIGGGGGARAVLEALRQAGTLEVLMVVRDPDAGRSLHAAFARSGAVYSLDNVDAAFSGSEFVVNATPLGMMGAEPMPASVLDGLSKVRDYGSIFDMVYTPPETELLKRARALGLRAVTGLDMLVGQARDAFQRFFGARPPTELDAELRSRLSP